MAGGIGTCWVCGKTGPLQEHHIWMQAAGGTEGPTVDLCPTCHAAIHMQAQNLVAKNAERKQYLPDDQLRRAAPLIRAVYRALRALKEDRPTGVPVKTMISLDPAVHSALHRLKMDSGYSNFGDFLAKILHEYAKSRI